VEFVRKNGHTPFRRWLPTILHDQWELLKQQALNFPLTQNKDTISWMWSPKGVFTVKSTYDRLSREVSGDSFSRIWKAHIPYKIKIFLWLMEQGALLTKENLTKRNCDELESLNHLFFTCPIAKVVWGIVAQSLEAINITTSLKQFWIWSQTWLPAKSHFYAFLLAAICWATWKTRNDACFNAKMIHHPAEIVCHACALLNYWAGLHK